LQCVPPTITAQQKGINARGGRVRVYTKPAVLEAERLIRTLLISHRIQPLQGPIACHFQFLWPYHRREPKPVLAERLSVCHATPPDFDNYSKLLCDCLTREKFFIDDGQIARALVEKYRSPITGIYIHLAVMPTTVEIPSGFCPNCWTKYIRATLYSPGVACSKCEYIEPLDFSIPEEDKSIMDFGTLSPDNLDL